MIECSSEKKQFRSKAETIDFKKHVLGKKRNNIEQYPYLCRECHYWHLVTEVNGMPKRK